MARARDIISAEKYDIANAIPHKGKGKSPTDILEDAAPLIEGALIRAGIIPITPPSALPTDAWDKASAETQFAVERNLDGLLHGGHLSLAAHVAIKQRLGL